MSRGIWVAAPRVESAIVLYAAVVPEGQAAAFAWAMQSPDFAALNLRNYSLIDTSPGACPTSVVRRKLVG